MRQRARFIFKVYRAEGLPQMDSNVTEKLKETFKFIMPQHKARDLVDPYVEISFCDQKVWKGNRCEKIFTSNYSRPFW